jgi:lipopolysaccharide export system permease protein
MKVLTKYISKEFIKLQIFCQIIFISLYLIVDFVQKIDNFIEHKVTQPNVIISYFLYEIPYIIVLMIPAATLISIIILFRLMKNNRELMAIKACGLNIINLSQTVLIISLFISLFTFMFSESVVPYASSKSNEIWDIEVNKQDPTKFYGSDSIWYKTTDAIYSIKHFDSVKKIMEDPTMYFFNGNFKLIKRIDAKKAIWQDDAWRLEDCVIQEIQADGDYNTKKYKALPLSIPETPETFQKRVKKPEEMSYRQLKEYSETVKSEGYDNTEYLVEMGVKIAWPLISFVLTLLGIPIALELKTGGIPLAVASGMGLCLLYYVISSISSALGHSGILPPFLAAWTANLLFTFVGIYLMMTVEQ